MLYSESMEYNKIESDESTGNGTITYKNGEIYTGKIQHNKRQGVGKYIYDLEHNL